MRPSPKKNLRILAHFGIGIALSFYTLASTAAPLHVVTSFSILADMTTRIGGKRIQVHSLVGPDADAHTYQPTPADARSIASSRLVIINGKGFEGWIERLIKSSGYRGLMVIASKGVTPLKIPHNSAKHSRKHEHHSDVDPHAWQDLSNASHYVDNIVLALIEIDPQGRSEYLDNASRYKKKILELDTEIRTNFAAIPAERRRVVSSHDAFGYFSRAYDIRFISPVGINTDAEPSAGDVAKIIRQIRSERVPAVFLESFSDPRLLERIRQESGAYIGGTLYSDALSGPDGPAPTYLDLMRHNAHTLTKALSTSAAK